MQTPVLALEPGEEGGGAIRDCWAVAFGHSYSDDERMVCAGFALLSLSLSFLISSAYTVTIMEM